MATIFNSKETAEKIEVMLKHFFATEEVVIEDQSHQHKGHKGAGGGGHFFVTIVSEKFNGLSPIARQRLVIEAVKPMMDREIHALSMKCLAKD